MKENHQLISFIQDFGANGLITFEGNTFENLSVSPLIFETIQTHTNRILGYFASPVEQPFTLLIDGEIYRIFLFAFDKQLAGSSGILGLIKSKKLIDEEYARPRESDELSTKAAIWKWNAQTYDIIIDQNWSEILGFELNEILPFTSEMWNEFIHPDDTSAKKDQMNEHLNGKTAWYECEVRLKHKLGHWVWVFDRGQIVSWTNDGAPEWVYGSHYDISKRKNTELKAQHHFRLLEETNEVAKIGTWEIDLASNLPKWSNYTCHIHGVEPGYQASIEEAIDFFKEGESRLSVQKHFSDAYNHGIHYDIHVIIVTKQGVEKWVRLVGIPEFQNDVCVRLYGMIQDIDEQKRQSIQLVESEEKFKQIFHYSNNGLATLDEEGNWLNVNKRLCEMLGYTPKEFAETNCIGITHTDDIPGTYAERAKLINGIAESFTSEKRYIHKNGKAIWCVLSVSIIRTEDHKPNFFIAQITPIDDLKKAERQIELTLGRLQTTLNAATQVSIIRCNCEGIIEEFNKGAENLLGYLADEVIGKTSPIIFHDPEEVSKRGIELSHELNRPIEGFNVFIEKTKEGQYEDREWTYIRKDGVRFTVQLVVTRIVGPNEEITGYLGIATDISRLKTIEYEMQSLLAVTNDQNNRLSNFAHIVSHNLRSHSGNFSLILDLLDLEQDETNKKKILEMLRTASNNLSDAILHLNEVANLTTSTNEECKPVFIVTAIEQAINNVQMELSAINAQVATSFPDEGATILGIPAYIDSILLNILTNAIKYRSKDRDLQLNISILKNEFQTEILIGDNGLGIDLKRFGSKIFGMYKTFHGNEDARGIGLFITKNQMDAMGGKIEVDSMPNVGSTFKLIFYEKN